MIEFQKVFKRSSSFVGLCLDVVDLDGGKGDGLGGAGEEAWKAERSGESGEGGEHLQLHRAANYYTNVRNMLKRRHFSWWRNMITNGGGIRAKVPRMELLRYSRAREPSNRCTAQGHICEEISFRILDMVLQWF